MKVNAKIQQERLSKAIALLEQISRDWNEEQTKLYPQTLMSFDELVFELGCIEFEDKNKPQKICDFGGDANNCTDCAYYPDYKYDEGSGECRIYGFETYNDNDKNNKI